MIRTGRNSITANKPFTLETPNQFHKNVTAIPNVLHWMLIPDLAGFCASRSKGILMSSPQRVRFSSHAAVDIPKDRHV